MRNLNARSIQQSNIPPVLLINCDRHQAPHGYQYVLQNGLCVLVNSGTGQVVHAQSGVGYIDGTQVATASVLPSVSGVTNWLQNNKGLALVLAGAGLYFLTKK